MNLNKKNIVTVFNTESLNHFFSNSEFRKVCEESRFCICDGIGLKLGSNLIGKEISRYHGPDFMEDTLKGILNLKKFLYWVELKTIWLSLKKSMIK